MRPTFRLLLPCCLVLLMTACADFRARENLRDGLLVLGLTQRDVLDIWDTPTHTTAISGDEIIKSGIAGWGGFFFKGREMYEKWDYAPRQTQLVFYQQRLVAWKTALTVQQLASDLNEPVKTPLPAAQPNPTQTPPPSSTRPDPMGTDPKTGPLKLSSSLRVN